MKANRMDPSTVRRTRAPRTAHAAVSLGLSLLVSSAGCGAARKQKSGKEPVPVRAEAVQAAGATSGVRYSANVQPREQVSLAFKSGGYVREIRKVRGGDGRPRNVQQGDAVAKGTVLARVRENDYAERVNQAKGQLGEAAAALEKQRLDYARSRALYESKSLSKSDFDGATAAFEQAKSRVDASRAQLDAAQIALDDCALTAPMDALVLARSVEEGALVGSGTVGFTLADTTSVKVVFGVPDTVQDLKAGRPINVSVEAVPGTKYSGRITAIAASADQQSRVFDVEVTIPNPGGRLKAGMIATVETPHESAAPGLAAGVPTVPLNAILKSPSDPNAYAVYVLGGDATRPVARIRDVKLGEIQGSRIAVTSGLSASDRVVVTGTTILVDGDPVRVIP